MPADKVAPPKALPKSAPVHIRPDWQEYIDSIPSRRHHLARVWTPEEDAFLLAARASGGYWPDICARLKVAEDTARNHYRELVAKGSKG